MESAAPFVGYPQPTSNTTYTPNQFFDVVLPHASRGAVRLVAYMLRKVLGWSDAEGRPQKPVVLVSYRQLEEEAGIGHSMIRQAIDEAIEARYIQCVRPGVRNAKGLLGSSALYELRWDERDRYITNPQEFQGFYAGNGNLTYIPNLFFDYTVRNETLSVVKVVGAIIRHTIGFQTRYGFRRQQVAMSFTELQRRVNIPSPTTLNDSVRQAIAHSHIVRVEEGYFDPDAGKTSRATVYAVRWIGSGLDLEPYTLIETPLDDTHPFVEPVFPGDISLPVEIIPKQHSEKRSGPHKHNTPKNVAGYTPKNVADQQSEKRSGNTPESVADELSENRSDLKITPSNNTLVNEQQQTRPAIVSSAAVASVLSLKRRQGSEHAFRLLLETGFDRKAAKDILEKSPPDRVIRQIQFAEKRQASKNRLGLIRKAIEEDWPEPLASTTVEQYVQTDESAFSQSFYAAWIGRGGESAILPSTGDLAAARRLLNQLESGVRRSVSAEGWGASFGRFVKKRLQEPSYNRLPKSLVIASREFGDVFIESNREQVRKTEAAGQEAERKAHETAFQHTWLAYVEARLEEISDENPEAVEAFREEERRQRRGVVNFTARLVPDAVEQFDSHEQHLRRFAEFFRENRSTPVLDFWSWDAKLNGKQKG